MKRAFADMAFVSIVWSVFTLVAIIISTFCNPWDMLPAAIVTGSFLFVIRLPRGRR